MHTPLDIMRIRTAELDEQGNCDLMSYRDSLKKTASPIGGAFGRVRSSGHKPHQGWDLYAPVGTPVHAIGAGRIVGVRNHGSYGLQLLLYLYGAKYHHHDLYAFYAHLSSTFVLPEQDVLRDLLSATQE